jgi:histidine triad (HIT) family protein
MNIFEKIIAKEIPANIVYEDDHSLAFHDINPQAPIHTLVIPKKSVNNIQNVDANTMGHLVVAIQNVASKLGLDKSGYRVITNNGEDAGQEVEHLHFHILGGTKLGHLHHKDESHKSN